MDLWMLIFCVMPAFVTSVTILSNGNSPETKMTRHMITESNKYNHKTPRFNEPVKYKTNKPININSTKLGINERYRRLIPYMTFYYANDIATPSTVPENEQGKAVEVDKAEIIETGNINPSHRDERVIHSFLRQKNIPRYQGNRLTQHNIASANPSKLYLKEVLPTFYQPPNKYTSNYNPLLADHNIYPDREREYEKLFINPVKAPSAPFSQQTRKPFLNFYQNDDANVQYYLSEKEVAPKYKLVPYEQTPPIKTFQQYENVEPIQQYVPVQVQKEPVYIKPRPKPTSPQFHYVHENEQYRPKKPPTTISEMYYEKQTPVAPLAEPIIESGFHPIIARPHTTETPSFTRVFNQPIPKLERPPAEVVLTKPSYQYVLEESSYVPKPTHNENTKTASLADLLNSLQINKSIPKPITKDNVSASINTLLQVLNALKAQQNEIEPPVLSTPKAFVAPDVIGKTTLRPLLHTTVESPSQDIHLEEPYLAHVNSPSQHLDEYPSSGSSQQFPQPIHSDEEGGTPGHPGVDYPTLTVIPPTKFDCKTQRYKGFFADPETRCQVWHYCDLNGGQASFLCPNGTIFSQAGLTCDWWFNVRCASTAQLYVLNESLYKFILPHSPKFPEDYSGPLVDKYLTLKFKEMEEQFKKNKSKNKLAASEKIDEDTTDAIPSEETNTEAKNELEERAVSNAGVIVESVGSSGNVERLQE